jgi:hypothetical protein
VGKKVGNSVVKNFVIILQKRYTDYFPFPDYECYYNVSERLVRSYGPNSAGFVILLLPNDVSTATSRNVVYIKYIIDSGQCAK